MAFGSAQSRLSDEQQARVIQQIKNGEATQGELARAFGVSSSTVAGVIGRARARGDLPPAPPRAEAKKRDNQRRHAIQRFQQGPPKSKPLPELEPVAPLTPPTDEEVMRAYASAIVVASRSP